METVANAGSALQQDALREGLHLGAEGIQVWDGDFYAVNPVVALGLAERGGLLRVGLMSYNTKEEVDRLISSLKDHARASGVQIDG